MCNSFAADDASDHCTVISFPVGKWPEITNTRSVAHRTDDHLLWRSIVLILLRHVDVLGIDFGVLGIDFAVGFRFLSFAFGHFKNLFLLHCPQ